MTAAEVLSMAQVHGVAVDFDGGDLVLAAKREPPLEVIAALRSEKSAILDLLKRRERDEWLAFFSERVRLGQTEGGESRADAEASAYSYCIIEWQNRNPVDTEVGKCAECGQRGMDGGAVVHCAIGARRTWLHPDCWSAWIEKRIREAESALAAFGICRPTATKV